MRIQLGALAAIALLVSPVASTADEPDFRSTAQLRKNGFSQCASSLNALTKFTYGSDDFAYRVFWGQTDTNNSTASLLAAKNYADGVSYSYIVSTPTPRRECDQSFTHIISSANSCASIRESTFKDWKYEVDLGTISTYADPTSAAVKVALLQVQATCIVIKTGTLSVPISPGANSR